MSSIEDVKVRNIVKMLKIKTKYLLTLLRWKCFGNGNVEILQLFFMATLKSFMKITR